MLFDIVGASNLQAGGHDVLQQEVCYLTAPPDLLISKEKENGNCSHNKCFIFFSSLPSITKTRENETFNDHNIIRYTAHLNISNTRNSGGNACSGPTSKQLILYCWKSFMCQNDRWKHHQQYNFLQDHRVKCFYTMPVVGSAVQPFISGQHYSHHYLHHDVGNSYFSGTQACILFFLKSL